MKVTTDKINSNLISEVEEISGQKVSACFQCAKCTGGCPVIWAMDIHPHQVLRYAQLGLADELLHSKTLWICASCQTCDSRCPREVDIPKVIGEEDWSFPLLVRFKHRCHGGYRTGYGRIQGYARRSICGPQQVYLFRNRPDDDQGGNQGT
jgi:CO dehydrogenase/acetyl-CoA synthase alpha subunit